MTHQGITFFPRLQLACQSFWKTLTNPEFANTGQVTLTSNTAPSDSALQLLGLLQHEGRFIDFIEQDVSAFSDAEIGAAAHVVHEGCRKVLHQYLKLEPIQQELEGSQITVNSGFDAATIHVTGNVIGTPPFQGTLTHRGWRVSDIKLPHISQSRNLNVLEAAEVEL